MKLIYFSPNMASYRGALYQLDVMEELTRQAQLYFYGPGFPDYQTSDTLEEVIAKASFTPDALVIGHGWLLDDAADPNVDPHPKIDFSKSDLPKIAILNKEYTNLKPKLRYLKDGKFDLAFSHHHEVEQYKRESGVRFIFWPFGVNHRLFYSGDAEHKRPVDIAFSGILQNQNEGSVQSDIRIRILQEIFHCAGDLPLVKKRPYAPLNISWNSRPRRNIVAQLARALGTYRRLSLEEYIRLQQISKVFVNTLSPLGLVSTRYFENMASGTLVLCEQTPLYSRIFGQANHFVTFHANLRDFHEKAAYFAKHEDERLQITTRAYADVMTNHTWEQRVRSLLTAIQVRDALPEMISESR